MVLVVHWGLRRGFKDIRKGFVSTHPNTSMTTALLFGSGGFVEALIYVRGAFSAQRVLWYFDCVIVICIVGVGVTESLGILIIRALLAIRYTTLSFCSNDAVRKVRVDFLIIIWIVLFESVRNLLLISGRSVVVLVGLFGLLDLRNIIVT